MSSKKCYFTYTNSVQMINIIKIYNLVVEKDHLDLSMNQLVYKNFDHCIFFNVIFFTIFLLSQNKSSIFYVLNIYMYLEKYIKTGQLRAK